MKAEWVATEMKPMTATVLAKGVLNGQSIVQTEAGCFASNDLVAVAEHGGVVEATVLAMKPGALRSWIAMPTKHVRLVTQREAGVQPYEVTDEDGDTWTRYETVYEDLLVPFFEVRHTKVGDQLINLGPRYVG